MKPAQAKAIIQDIRKRRYVEHGGVFYPPEQAAALSILETVKKPRTHHIKTGWIDDTRNLANKAKQSDMFMKLVMVELGLDVWPEFYFDTERQYRLDYAIPEYKVGVEVDGGIFAKGNSGHSSGKGIKRDQEKSSLLASKGWFLIRITPHELLSLSTIELIKKTISHAK